jgi:hypothetical protein
VLPRDGKNPSAGPQAVSEINNNVGIAGNSLCRLRSFRKLAQILDEAGRMVAQNDPVTGLDSDFLDERCS